MRQNFLYRALLILALSPTAVSLACMNEYNPNEHVPPKPRGLIDDLTEASVAEPWDVRVTRLQKAVANGGNYEVENDLAIALAHTGAAEKALAIFQKIEKEHPG